MSHSIAPSPSFSLRVADALPCKCCGAEARPAGEVDFHKSCEDQQRGAPFAPSGVAVRYHRCGGCGFLFTGAFDEWSHADFLAHVYNESYILVDPDFIEARPRGNAEHIATRLFPGSPSLRLLDYGGGNGMLADLLVGHGFSGARTYDPFYAGREGRPTGRFDVVTAFEVLEHSTDPLHTLREMRWFMDDRGMLLFSTLMQPADIDRVGLDWWYAAPRNGHVSLYSRAALDSLMRRLGLACASFNDVLHVAYRKRLPPFAAHLAG